MTKPNARVIADSITMEGDRITTMEVTLHRFMLPELNTHRAFSRNSASSRAIPANKMVTRVRNDPAMPITWSTEKPGMSGGVALDVNVSRIASVVWQEACDDALDHADTLMRLGVHKSIINRLLEPFSWHTVIITATEWNNFFTQRCHEAAQPEIREAAEAMRTALELSIPNDVAYGNWHLPYLQDDELNLPTNTQLLLCAARCARVSYLTHDGQRDQDKDWDLAQKLLKADPPHASPFEHIAMATYGQHANFKGWCSYRKVLDI